MKHLAAKAYLLFAAAYFVPLGIAGAQTTVDQATLDTREIMAGTVSTASIKTEYRSGKRDGTTAFKGARAQVVRLYYRLCPNGVLLRSTEACPVAPPPPPPPVVCPDGTTLPAGSTCPVLPPPLIPAKNECGDARGLPIPGSYCPTRTFQNQCPGISSWPANKPCP